MLMELNMGFWFIWIAPKSDLCTASSALNCQYIPKPRCLFHPNRKTYALFSLYPIYVLVPCACALYSMVHMRRTRPIYICECCSPDAKGEATRPTGLARSLYTSVVGLYSLRRLLLHTQSVWRTLQIYKNNIS